MESAAVLRWPTSCCEYRGIVRHERGRLSYESARLLAPATPTGNPASSSWHSDNSDTAAPPGAENETQTDHRLLGVCNRHSGASLQDQSTASEGAQSPVQEAATGHRTSGVAGHEGPVASWLRLPGSYVLGRGPQECAVLFRDE